MNLNSKLRRRGNISAWEINTARDQNTGDNLNLDDKAIRDNQLKKRIDERKTTDVEDVEIGDTVRIRNKNDKHKANDIYLVTSKDEVEDKVGVQKILHPLENTKGKFTSTVMKTNKKHLSVIHKPEFPEDESEEEDFKEENEKVKSIPQSKPWNPINPQFYDNSSDDEEDCNVLTTLNREDFDDEQSSSEEENIQQQLEWDSSPEQILLQTPSADNNQLRDALQPRRLFAEEGETELDEDLTPDTSDDEVFVVDQFKTPPSAIKENKLKRSNAMRRRNRTPASEPRVTRTMLHSNRYLSVSNPTSPSQVNLNEAQNLENVLHPIAPVVAAAVNMEPGVVQLLDEALDDPNITNRRRSSRNQNRKDYSKMQDPWKKR